MSLNLQQLYVNGDKQRPSIKAAVDSKGRWLHYSETDHRISIGKLLHRCPSTVAESDALLERCRVRTGLDTITWYAFGSDVIEIPASDIERVDAVCAAYKAEGFPIARIMY